MLTIFCCFGINIAKILINELWFLGKNVKIITQNVKNS